ncbi:MAG: hypothetical protein RL538_586, partial [Candidatus Parcubacteria bacterium]
MKLERWSYETAGAGGNNKKLT